MLALPKKPFPKLAFKCFPGLKCRAISTRRGEARQGCLAADGVLRQIRENSGNPLNRVFAFALPQASIANSDDSNPNCFRRKTWFPPNERWLVQCSHTINNGHFTTTLILCSAIVVASLQAVSRTSTFPRMALSLSVGPMRTTKFMSTRPLLELPGEKKNGGTFFLASTGLSTVPM